MTQSNLNSIMENFHLCSHLPIRAFNNVGQELYSIGYEVHEEQLFKQYFSGRLIRERVSELTTNYFSTYSLPDGISFTMCLIDKEDIEKGTFIRLVENCRVSDALQKAMNSREKRTEITQDKVLKELAKIGFSNGS